MKRLIIAGWLGLALASAAQGGPLTGYTNDGYVVTVPNGGNGIDATNFVNNGLFDFDILGYSFQPFVFSDVQTYTNRGVMYCDLGFLFNTSPATSQDPPAGPAAGFSNQNSGQIYADAQFPLTNTVEVFGENAALAAFGIGLYPQLIIEATNITSSGLLDVGQTGEISVTGNAVDLSYGSILVEGFDQLQSGLTSFSSVALAVGVFDDYWGIGQQSNALDSAVLANFTPPLVTAPFQKVTTSSGVAETVNFAIDNAQIVALTNETSPSNIFVQAIIFGDSVGQVNISGHFELTGTNFANGVVEWSSIVTNAFGQVITNTLYLTDDLGSLTQLSEVTNNVSLRGLPLLVPTNYTIFSTPPGPLVPGNVAKYNSSLFANAGATNMGGGITNAYSSLEVSVADVTAQPDPTVAGSTLSNIPGTVKITANNSLNMTSASISAGNYLSLSSTNHYVGSQGAHITFPYADIALGSTNGQLTVSNLVVPYLPRLTGTINCYSAIWTNLTSATNAATTNVFTVTNEYLILMVSSALQSTSPVYIDNFSLRSTNVVISDELNIDSSLLINAQSLTITSNAPGDITPEGELLFNQQDGDYLYSVNLPGLQYFTNSGLFETVNAAFFQTRQDPNNPTAGDGPWQSIVNQGSIFSGGGDVFWANNFQNTGFIESSGFGPITVQSSTALVTNGFMIASAGDMAFTSGSLTINNESLSASGSLSLATTNLLTDLSAPGVLTNSGSGNIWVDSDGLNLTVAPASGDLLGTTITNGCIAGTECQNIWAGVVDTNISLTTGFYTNFLPVMAGNAPLGQLILNGGNTGSVFHFEGPDTVHPYAMYVDQLELQGGATNLSPGTSNVFTAFNIDTNFTIYYLDALAGTNDISARLNKTQGGHLVWLSNYVGRFSYTNITYKDGLTFAFNRALAQSTNIDSNSNGIPNASDTVPFTEPPLLPTPQSIGLAITLTKTNSSNMAAISWLAPAYSTNTLYDRTISNTNWLVQTNFVQGSTNSRVTVLESLATNLLYKVGITSSRN
jgi:hypothetical protein